MALKILWFLAGCVALLFVVDVFTRHFYLLVSDGLILAALAVLIWAANKLVRLRRR